MTTIGGMDTFVVHNEGAGFGYTVRENSRANAGGKVAGPFASRESAQREADRLNEREREREQLAAEIRDSAAAKVPASLDLFGHVVHVLDGQDKLNRALERALQGMVLAQERYDTELQEIRERLDALEAADTLTDERFAALNRLHSVKS